MRRKLEAAGYLVSRHTYPPGTAFPEHSHRLDKVDAVISGRFRMVVAGHFAILGPGDWVEVPRGVHHSAAVVGSEPVVSLDAARMPPLERSEALPQTVEQVGKQGLAIPPSQPRDERIQRACCNGPAERHAHSVARRSNAVEGGRRADGSSAQRPVNPRLLVYHFGT